MKHLIAISLFSLILCIGFERIGVYGRPSAELRVFLPDGSTMTGRTLTSRCGRPIRAFMGIPFAKPPIGELRFRAPEPIGKLKDELDATRDGNICIQLGADSVVGSEDCLYLNVYTPYQHNKTLENLPVMVFIHGGSFEGGEGMSAMHAPDILLDHDIIFVSGNYRLGIMGFLSSGQADCSGNFGLKDQVEVLKWIQTNIIAFGGDPNSVTIYGQSAGAGSVTYLMMSPLTTGLITRAIAQSGTNVGLVLPDPTVAPQRAIKLTESMNCSHTGNWSKTMDCMRVVPAENITAAIKNFYVSTPGDPLVPFPPVVESTDSPEACITEDARKTYSPQASSIPLLIGITHDEGAVRSALLINNPSLFDNFAKIFDSILPVQFLYDHLESAAQQCITHKIGDFYFNNLPLDVKKHGENITKLYTDGWFLAGIDTYLRMRFTIDPVAPTYVYFFTHKGSSSYTELMGGAKNKFYGVCHCDDLQYAFPKYKTVFSNALPTNEDLQMRDILPELLVNFARTGNPTPSESMLPKWHQITRWPSAFYRIGNYDYDDKPICGMEDGGIYEERAEFWRQLRCQ